MRATAAIHVARAIAGFTRARGVDPGPLLAACGIDARLLEDPDARVSHETIVGLFEAAARALDDPLFGLRLGASLPPGSLHLAEYVIRAGGTLRDALPRWMRFQRLVYDAAPFAVEESGEEVTIAHRVPREIAPPPVVLDYAIANVVRIARQLTDGRFTPTRVALARPAPPSDAPYREVFQAPLRFGVPASNVWFRRADLDLVVTPSDPTLQAMLASFAEERLARLPAPGDVVDEVRAALRRALDGTTRPPASAIARRLGMSERTLGRRLHERGQSFTALLDDVSRGVAIEQLERGSTATEVAFLLGFSELSAFHRAFRRWTGVTPRDFQRRRAGAP